MVTFTIIWIIGKDPNFSKTTHIPIPYNVSSTFFIDYFPSGGDWHAL